MRKLFLVVSISFLSLNFASASYLKHEDIITDQVDLVSSDERARAGKLKSPGGWEVKQTAYNAKTGLVEVVAQNNDKYSNIVLNPRSVSWSARLAGMVGSALSKGAGLFSWIPFLVSNLADDGHNMYYDPDGYIKLRPKPEFQDRVRYYVPHPTDYNFKFYSTTTGGAANLACVHFSQTRLYISVGHVYLRDGIFESHCQAADPEKGGLVSLPKRFYVEPIPPETKYTYKEAFADRLSQFLKTSREVRNIYRRSAEYDVAEGLYDDKLNEKAVKVQPGTAPKIKVGSEDVVWSPSPTAPEVFPDFAPGTSPSPSTNPSPRPNEQPVPSPSTSPSPGGMNVQFPNFCDWASTICTLADYLRKKEVDPKTGKVRDDESDETDTYNVDILEVDKTAGEFDQDYLNYGGSCPAAVKFSIDVGAVAVPLEFTLQPLCDFAKTVRPAILALAYLAAMGIVANAIRG